MVQPFIFKFGGASVRDAVSFQNVASILKTHWKNGLVVVVSASGDTTDYLEEIIEKAFSQQDFDREIAELEEYHIGICTGLFPSGHSVFSQVNNLFVQLKRKLVSDHKGQGKGFLYDQTIVFGELLSTRILHEYLCQSGLFCLWQDARELIATDSSFKMAKVDWVATMQRCRKLLIPALEKCPVITQGFMGSDWMGNTTTLGREGSDFTAAILAVSTGAKSVSIWKDVAGILNGDPDIFPDAIKFDYLDFEEAAEMTYFGAKVIHPKTIKPLAKQKIPLFVKSFANPDQPGTVIGSFEDHPKIPITVIKPDQVWISFRVRDLSKVGGFHYEEMFKTAKSFNWTVNMLQSTAVTLHLVIDQSELIPETFPTSLMATFHIQKMEGLKLVTVKNYGDDHEKIYRDASEAVLLTEKSPNTLQMLIK
ncbi:Aspartokinase [Lunatimonas lonarensis]|uniref:Aspartokinase n=1 Tax=Lunatimonas lonarensis TaxID=1232681 RepID=R7ZUC7_9BACT|nr:aspartate kinase [Lunatimonas lonarensis]EON77633.1 Aspartokinase [Lunatimonas lonarensis]